ncbi:unnamed protein product, partial [Heterosigma akashiwo]
PDSHSNSGTKSINKNNTNCTMSLKQNERPVASILTKLKDDDRAMVIHRKKLAATKPMVDTGKPSTQK